MNPEQTSGQNNGQLPPQNPQQSQPGTNPALGEPGHNPYAFILNPEKPKKKSLPISDNSMLQRVTLVGGGLVLLIILVIVFSSLLTSGGKEKTEDFLAIAQDQTELIRVATDASQHTTTLPAQSLAQSVRATVTSDNGELLDYLENNGQKISPKQLALSHNKKTDAALESAQDNGTYDSAFKDVIRSSLDSYLVDLQKAYKANPGPKGKAMLSKQYDAATLLKTASQQN